MHWLGLIKGGPGSGNFDHAGRPGEVGGSAPDDGGTGSEASTGSSNSSREHGSKVRAWAKEKFGDDTTAENFARWFGDSKVVDADGNPLVVYHGTSVKFTAFDLDATKKGTRNAFFFTPSKKLASEYAWSPDTDEKFVIEAYVSVQNPAPNEAIKQANGDPKKLAGLGYDGWIVRGERGEIAVFSPTQIKSATGNSGTFDPKDPNITKSAERLLDYSVECLGLLKGGPGSGNFGHAGRPGQVGGSAPDDTPSGTAEIPSADEVESSRDLVTLGKYDDWRDSSGKRKVTLFHYSREDRTSTGLKREFAGSAGAGEEKRSFEYDKEGKLNVETVPVHAYMYGAKKESMVPGNVLHKIEAELNVLDVGSKKYREILSKAREEAERTGRPMLAMARALAREEGYDALSSERDGIVQILRDVKPEELQVIGGKKKASSYKPGPSPDSRILKERAKRWDVKLTGLSKDSPEMEMYSLQLVADDMVARGALTKEDRWGILGGMVGSDLAGGKPAIDKKIEKLKSKIIPGTSEDVRKRIDENFNFAITFGKTKEEIKENFVKQAERLLADKPKVAIRAPIDVVDLILDDGRFKSQFETNSSQGTLDFDLRKSFEMEGFGVPEDTPDEQRPIYGYMTDKNAGYGNYKLNLYGGVAFVLKDSVKENTTVTFGDSLDGELPSSKIGNVKIESMEIVEGLVSEDSFGYVEAQIHGGVKLGDVEEIVIGRDTLGKMLRAYNAAKDAEGEEGGFSGFVGGKLFSSGLKVSVVDAYEGDGEKELLEDWLKSNEWYKRHYKGSQAGDALEAQLEVNRGKKTGSDNRPSWW